MVGYYMLWPHAGNGAARYILIKDRTHSYGMACRYRFNHVLSQYHDNQDVKGLSMWDIHVIERLMCRCRTLGPGTDISINHILSV